MKRVLGKLGFMHRRLWHQDGLYRVALLFGPAPLLGAILAGALWTGTQALEKATYQPPLWAAREGPDVWNTGTNQPQVVQPTLPLPPTEADGILTGYEPGWQMATEPIEVNAAMNVDLKATPLTAFSLEGSTIDMAQIIANGQEGSLYVGAGSTYLAIRTAGIYALTARFERPAGRLADCLVRLGFGTRRIISNLVVSAIDNESRTYEAARFDLQPGLYTVGLAFGCWHDHTAIGPGRITLLVGHPGEQTLLPARSDDILRPASVRP